MTVSFDIINQRIHRKKSTAKIYSRIELQNPEAVIFLKYKDCISGKRVLDIGCGAGRTTFFLSHLTENYVGIDYSRLMLKICKKRFSNAMLIEGDVRNMGMLKGNLFDFVLFSYNGLDYIGHDDRQRALQEIHRVLKEDGIVVLSSHNRNCHYGAKGPRMIFSWNICTLARNAIRFVTSAYNVSRNRRFEVSENEYAVINDPAQNYALLTYYIDKNAQAAQLSRIGFEVTEMYDVQGNSLRMEDDDQHSAWIYYVAARKR